jgi:hypothetical protein
VKIHVAALPVPYRIERGRADLRIADREGRAVRPLHPGTGALPVALDPFQVTRYEIAAFAATPPPWTCAISASAAAPDRTTYGRREALGRRPPASRFSPDMSKHYAYAMMHACGRRTAIRKEPVTPLPARGERCRGGVDGTVRFIAANLPLIGG